MSLRSASARHTRPKKLGPKQNVQIFREDEVDQLDFDANRGASQVETGVEKGEEQEYHLQQAISASQAIGKAKQAYIPTPPIIASSVQYDVLYPKKFQQPATYIRSSATVEDCSGSAYCMDEEDEIALKQINSKQAQPATEDLFEEVMSFLEETASTKQPFAAVDNPPVLSFEEIQDQIDDNITSAARRYVEHIYPHWKSRREQNGNDLIQPHLKSEQNPDSDDSDPYVCFRRREVRQIRKTRGRDAQSSEKLKRLRAELEDARQLISMVKHRELAKKEQLVLDRLLFSQRAEVKDTKRKLGIKGDDEDLVNQKPKKKPELTPAQQAGASQLRFPIPGRGGDDLRLLEDLQSEKDKIISKDIKANIEKHSKWNATYVDKTMAPLTPELEKSIESSSDFRQAMPATEYLPTPPASISDESPTDLMIELESPTDTRQHPFRYLSPSNDDQPSHMPSFRRRLGRGGRMMFDRRLGYRSRNASNAAEMQDRYRYDSDEEDVSSERFIDEHDTRLMSNCAYLAAKEKSQADAMQQQAQAAQLRRSQGGSSSVALAAANS
ncbi:MAG: hypothetical protein Q9227_003004 [Pyrenula ochraceoflavens]